MKRKFKRASKSMLSVILAILIVMSTMLIGTLSVNAAENGKFTAGETIYFDFTSFPGGVNINLKDDSYDYVASCDPSWNDSTDRYISGVTDYVAVTLSRDIDFSQYTGNLCKVGSDGWSFRENDKAKIPTGSQNMIVVKSDGNYEWGTYSNTPTPPGNTNYYIEGRFRVKNTSGTNAALLEWAFDSTSIPFNATENDGIYKIETNCTLSDLSENIYCPNGDYTASQYFYVWEQNSNQYYSASNLNMQNCLGSGNAASMSSCTFDSNDNWMHFSGTNSAVSSDAKITLYLDTNNGMKLYYTTDEVSEPHNVTIKSNIKVTATAEGADPVVLNETGDSETEGSTTVSASTLTLTASAVDYNFAGWKLGEGASIMSGSVTSPTITVKVTADTTTTSVAPDNSITLRAISEPSTIRGYKYTFYHSDDAVIGGTDDTAINTPSSTDIKTLVLTPSGAGKHYYYVVASCDGKESVTSEMICVTVEEQRAEHTVRVWFKSASTNVYVPSVSLDGGAYTRMTRIKQGLENSTYFGSTYSGSLKFYWYFADVTLDSTFTHKLTFKTAGTSVIATSESSKFNSDNYYFAVDNLMNDTKLVDLTDKPDYIRNYHRSATHMVYNNLLDADSSLGFTYVYENGVGKEYPMGYILKQQNDNSQNEAQTVALNSRLVKIDVPSAASLGAGNAAFTIESATLTQKFVADIIDVSELQRCLLDVNLDEQVDIRDVTLMQKALAQ